MKSIPLPLEAANGQRTMKDSMIAGMWFVCGIHTPNFLTITMLFYWFRVVYELNLILIRLDQLYFLQKASTEQYFSVWLFNVSHPSFERTLLKPKAFAELNWDFCPQNSQHGQILGGHWLMGEYIKQLLHFQRITNKQ